MALTFQQNLPGLPQPLPIPAPPTGVGPIPVPGIQPPEQAGAPQADGGGLDAFLRNISDPTGSSQFLLDLGARLLQPRAKGSSPLGAIAGAAASATQGLGDRRAAAGQAATQKQITNSRLATEELQRGKLTQDIAAGEQKLEGQGLRDEEIRASIDLKKATAEQRRRLAKKGGTAKIASKVQEAERLAPILWKNHGPGSTDPKYQKFSEASEAAFRFFQPTGKDPDAWYANAVLSYRSKNGLLMDEAQLQAGIQGIGQVRDEWKKSLGIPEGGTAAPAQIGGGEPPEVTSALAVVADDPRKLNPDQIKVIQDWVKTQGQSARDQYNAALQQGRDNVAGAVEPEAVKAAPATEAPPKPPTREERKAKRVAMRAAIKQAKFDRAEKKLAQALKAEDDKRIIQATIDNEIPLMGKAELRAWLQEHKKELTSLQIRRIRVRIRKAGRGS